MKHRIEKRSWAQPSLLARATLGVMLTLAWGAAEPAAALTVLHDFNLTDGKGTPFTGVLAQGRDGNLYGTTEEGGTHKVGVAFRLTPSGEFTKLHDFKGTDGSGPEGGLTLGRDGNFYGATRTGGAARGGTVFKMTPAGVVTVLHHFLTAELDGCSPTSPPIQASDRNLYGTTFWCGTFDGGTVYKITPDGAFSVLHSFGGAGDLDTNPFGSLIQGTDGALYGAASDENSSQYGSVFKITTSGVFSTVYRFNSQTVPYRLIQGTDGNLYGTTAASASVFKLTLAGAFTILHSFYDRALDDAAYFPYGGLVQGSDGNFYGAAVPGSGVFDGGVLFRITPGGEYTVQARFDRANDGAGPFATPFLHTNGKIYGLTVAGGPNGFGTVYQLDVGAPSFIRAVPGTAKVGQTIGLLGAVRDPATVTFNGLDAPLSGTGANYHTAVVPAGAATGLIEVMSPAGTAQTLKPFQQRPAQKGFSPHRGAVGSSVVLNGTSLTQTTEVLFGNGESASFVVNSDSQITATVPVGAATGNITVITQGGRFTTVNAFTVKP